MNTSNVTATTHGELMMILNRYGLLLLNYGKLGGRYGGTSRHVHIQFEKVRYTLRYPPDMGDTPIPCIQSVFHIHIRLWKSSRKAEVYPH